MVKEDILTLGTLRMGKQGFLFSKCFAGVAEPTCKDESLLKKPVQIPSLSTFTTAVEFFY